MTDKRNPPDSVIQTGYMMIQARNAIREGKYSEMTRGVALGYVSQAIVCAAHAEDDLMEENPESLRMKFGEGQFVLGQALDLLWDKGTRLNQAKHKISHAHTLVRSAYKRLGYRELTEEDFLRFGVGGGGGR